MTRSCICSVLEKHPLEDSFYEGLFVKLLLDLLYLWRNLLFMNKLILTFRANFREKIRIALSSWDEHKNHHNPRTSRRPPGHHRAPQENARGRIIGQPLPAQWQLAGIEPRLDDGRVVGLYPLRGRPPALSRRA